MGSFSAGLITDRRSYPFLGIPEKVVSLVDNWPACSAKEPTRPVKPAKKDVLQPNVPDERKSPISAILVWLFVLGIGVWIISIPDGVKIIGGLFILGGTLGLLTLPSAIRDEKRMHTAVLAEYKRSCDNYVLQNEE